eukprot:477215_1
MASLFTEKNVFVMECLKCAAKTTASGLLIGGDKSCAHKYELIIQSRNNSPRRKTSTNQQIKKQKKQIKKQNKHHNNKHTKQSISNLATLEKIKATKME